MTDKILIGVTCHDSKQYVIDLFIKSIRNLDYEADIVFVDNSKEVSYSDYIRNEGFEVILSNNKSDSTYERLKDAYNVLRSYFLEKDYTHLMVIEQDVIVPKDTIQRLLNHKKDIVSGLYYLKDLPCVMVGEVKDVPPGREREFRFEKKAYFYDFIDKKKLNGDLIEIFAAGLGCCLIKKEVLEKIEFRIDRNGNIFKGHNDMAFHFDCRAKGYQVFLDSSIECEHHNYIYKDCAVRSSDK